MTKNGLDFFDETQRKLEQWGRWCRADGNKTSYPSLATFAKEMPRDIESSIAIMSDDEAQEIESSMLQLKNANLLAYKVAIYRYIHRRTLRDTAALLKIGNERTRIEWRLAVYFIMGNLYKYTA
jgi:hypothetical protein